ncbi:hypothetical protein C0995_001124, partial [Termitomyces sp. Mi166
MAMNYQQQFPHPRAASAINPAILAALPTAKSKFPATPAAPAMSPAQLISQQQQQHPAMSINPAQLMSNQSHLSVVPDPVPVPDSCIQHICCVTAMPAKNGRTVPGCPYADLAAEYASHGPAAAGHDGHEWHEH